ncbi:Uu.00g005320.m01.CDS01 [Anthostomella pinea]|uniref:Uu.00g005320.m01.CDS01 n=1 Tax=Anthostomella pinea TaxID=933095 RepID=A0AAI8VKT7_9PEZI|nr:Uu.00g005320.m01.CDS01 [Anthostomella pinea]
MAATFPIVTSAQRSVFAVAIIFAILPFIAVVLRLAAHRVAHRKLDSSDYFIVAAAVLAVSLEAISITAAEYGMEPITKLLKLVIPLQLTWALSLSCTKISILLLYMHVFPVTALIWTARATIVIIIMWATATILAGLLICKPLAFNWDQTIPGGSCGDQVLSFTITGIVNLITDIMALALPLPFLFQLQMKLYKKVVLMCVFSLGFLTCVVSGFRIKTLNTMDFADITYSIPQANIFSGLEPSVGVNLVCVPLLRPLFGRSGYSSSGTANYKGGSGSGMVPGTIGKGSRLFEPLSDGSSQYRLRPVGPKYGATITTTEQPGTGATRHSEDSHSHGSDPAGDRDSKGIMVTHEWNVS